VLLNASSIISGKTFLYSPERDRDSMLGRYSFKEVEEKVSKQWDDLREKIAATLQYDPNKKIFSFLEGPPTANAPPGLHHVEMRVFKDVMCRFKYMQGFTVPRKGGWDTHGLPVEVQLEKKLGLKTKKDVVTYGIAKFNAECRKDVFRFIKPWEDLTKRMAYWIDLEKPYVTLENEYIESVWWSLKELFNKGMLYQGHKVVPFCPRCETPLSSHEVALGYHDITEPAITIAFQWKDNPKRYFLAWTTTPWTLPSNVCLALHPDVTYAVVEDKGKEYVLAKELVNSFFDQPNIIEEKKGKEFDGQEYVPQFPYFVGKLDKPAWKVVMEDYVTTTEGTGIVHQAPAFGEDDYESCKKHGLPFVQPVNEDGTFTEEVENFAGMFVKDADPKIIEYLDEKGLLFKQEPNTHTYPFCWRCKTPLIYYALISWFIAVSKMRDKLMEKNQTIAWYPAHIKDGRFGKWLEGAKDWALSRMKFWGTPLPIWQCEKCKALTAVGSIEELKEGKNVPQEIDLHKPYIDQITFDCQCGGEMKRIPDVIDTWYDSGSAPFAQLHYPFENKELFEKFFPYDFIAEAIDQTRGWFYTLLVLSTLLFDNVAYKRCAVGGLLHDEHGHKMSKTRGNVIKPNDIFDEVGVDALRLLTCSYPLGDAINFSKKPIKEYIHPMLSILWNSVKYAQQFMHLQGGDNAAVPLQPEDKWIVSRVNSLTQDVQSSLDKGSYTGAVSALRFFITDDLSRWYIKIVRDRALQKDEALAYTFSYVIPRVLQVLAPFAPYITEELYQAFAPEQDSIHFASWPEVEQRNEKLEGQMTVAREIVQAGLAARERAKQGLRWPLKTLWVRSEDKDVGEAINALKSIIAAQTNVKEVTVIQEKKEDGVDVTKGTVYLDTETTPELLAEGHAREVMRRIQQARKDAGLQKQDRINLVIAADDELVGMLAAWKDAIREKVGAEQLELGKPGREYQHSSEEKVKGKTFTIFFDKL